MENENILRAIVPISVADCAAFKCALQSYLYACAEALNLPLDAEERTPDLYRATLAASTATEAAMTAAANAFTALRLAKVLGQMQRSKDRKWSAKPKKEGRKDRDTVRP